MPLYSTVEGDEIECGKYYLTRAGKLATISNINTSSRFAHPVTGIISGYDDADVSWSDKGHYFDEETPDPRDLMSVAKDDAAIPTVDVIEIQPINNHAPYQATEPEQEEPDPTTWPLKVTLDLDHLRKVTEHYLRLAYDGQFISLNDKELLQTIERVR